MRSAGSIRDMQMPSGADCAAARPAAQLSPTPRGSLLLSRVALRARSSAWLEPAALNGLVAGSNPAGPTGLRSLTRATARQARQSEGRRAEAHRAKAGPHIVFVH